MLIPPLPKTKQIITVTKFSNNPVPKIPRIAPNALINRKSLAFLEEKALPRPEYGPKEAKAVFQEFRQHERNQSLGYYDLMKQKEKLRRVNQEF